MLPSCIPVRLDGDELLYVRLSDGLEAFWRTACQGQVTHCRAQQTCLGVDHHVGHAWRRRMTPKCSYTLCPRVVLLLLYTEAARAANTLPEALRATHERGRTPMLETPPVQGELFPWDVPAGVEGTDARGSHPVVTPGIHLKRDTL